MVEACDYRVVVDSLGRADARLIGVLARALNRGEQTIAELLMRSPAILIDAVPRELAERSVELLRSTGVELRIDRCDAPFVAGEGCFELALIVPDVARASEITAEVARVVGCSPGQAIELVCASPAVLLGAISAATVAALRARFEPLGAMLIASDQRSARYDVLLVDSEASERGRVARLLDGLGIRRSEDGSPLLAGDLDRRQAEALWERLRGTGGPLRVLDRAFARFDIRLLELAPEPRADLAPWLAGETGMPLSLATTIAKHLPLILHEELERDQAERCLVELAERGARAEALLTTFQTFDLELRSLGRIDATLDLLAGLGRMPAERVHELEPRLRIGSPGLRIPGPFGKLRARWLASELAAIGTHTELLPR